MQDFPAWWWYYKCELVLLQSNPFFSRWSWVLPFARAMKRLIVKRSRIHIMKIVKLLWNTQFSKFVFGPKIENVEKLAKLWNWIWSKKWSKRLLCQFWTIFRPFYMTFEPLLDPFLTFFGTILNFILTNFRHFWTNFRQLFRTFWGQFEPYVEYFYTNLWTIRECYWVFLAKKLVKMDFWTKIGPYTKCCGTQKL